MKTYSEIDIEESPIVVLSCGHFFTAETLDSMIGMSEVYDQDSYGNFTGMKDMSGELAVTIPRCPDCNRPIRQFVTPRYNRVINRAVIDEISKRFLVRGKYDLLNLESVNEELSEDFENTRQDVIDNIK